MENFYKYFLFWKVCFSSNKIFLTFGKIENFVLRKYWAGFIKSENQVIKQIKGIIHLIDFISCS